MSYDDRFSITIVIVIVSCCCCYPFLCYAPQLRSNVRSLYRRVARRLNYFNNKRYFFIWIHVTGLLFVIAETYWDYCVFEWIALLCVLAANRHSDQMLTFIFNVILIAQVLHFMHNVIALHLVVEIVSDAMKIENWPQSIVKWVSRVICTRFKSQK